MFQERADLVANVTLEFFWYDYMCHISNLFQTNYPKLGVKRVLLGHFNIKGKRGNRVEMKNNIY